ncbi:xylulose kinase, variant [Capsaspora owczarzaki ATCC 30864]|nr:xylulose kinase, variant [Capsaspora owczarzaki ATCC 30864]
MDSSTAAECAVLEQAVGGPEKLAAISGSRAYERFTGAQIAKLQRTKPDQMAACERISLVSSFVASLLIGGYAPIDESDGSGMNLLNLQTRNWEARLLQATQVSDLSVKLGAPVPSDTLVGTISRYFVSRYGFAEDCVVGAFTGDNPASLAGMRIGEGDMTVSLGTSDTLFLWLKDTQSLQQERTTLDGHVFCNPVDTQSYMALLCYKNGSLARERVRDRALHLNSEQTQTQKWAAFDAALASTPVGNNGIVAAYFDQTEITPSARGELRLGADGNEVAALSPEQEIRSLIEGQFLAKRLHAERLGYNTSSARRILATGGASNNGAILQILANVFGARVYRLEQANSAALGCAFRAVHSWRKHGSLHDARSFEQATAQAEPPKLVAVPDPAATAVYNQLLQAYANVESLLVARTKRDA